MGEIIKSKGNMIAKLFVFQIATSLFGLFVLTPFAGTDDSYRGYLNIAAAVFATLFYFSLVAYAVIEDGQKDFVSASAGRLKGSPYTGLIYGLVSYVPTIIVVVANSILSIFTSPESFATVKSVLGVLLTKVFLMGTYWGFDAGIILRDENRQVISGKALESFSDHGLVFVVCLIFLPLVSGICYNLAYKGKIHVNTEQKKKK